MSECEPSPKPFEALRKARKDGATWEFYANNNPQCPHCGSQSDISRQDWSHLYEEGDHNVTCPECNNDFTVNTRVSFSFSTDIQEDEE